MIYSSCLFYCIHLTLASPAGKNSSRQSYCRPPPPSGNGAQQSNGVENIPEEPAPRKTAAPAQVGGGVGGGGGGTTGRRKSNCVKDVEKIKQKRDERRAAQVAIKEVADVDFDTSRPQWQFEQMIR